jgi:hypothetical protein
MADVDLDPYKELGLSDRPDASDADIRQVCVKCLQEHACANGTTPPHRTIRGCAHAETRVPCMFLKALLACVL